MQFKLKFKIFNIPLFRSTDFWIILFLNIVVLFLISTWFRGQMILATAEEGIPLYNSLYTLHSVSTVWQDVNLGYSSPFVFPLITLFGFTAFLEKIGITAWLSQAILFYLYILTALVSTYYLCKLLLASHFKWTVGLMASCFYLFNLYTYTQVWGRFIYSLFSLWALLPLFILLWGKWIESYKLRYLFLLLLASTFFSNVFALPSALLTIWIPVTIYTFFSLFKSKEKIKIVTYSILGLFLWILTNMWWLYPLWIFRNGSSLGGFSGQTNLQAVQEVSKYFPLDQIIFLKQSYLFGVANFWGVFYAQQKPYLVSVVILLITFLGIIVSRKYKTWGFLIILFIISIFIVKGTNPPFGEQIYNFLFTHIAITQVLRNPYEKFGVAFLLPYAIFFGIGISYIASFFKRFTLPVLIICFFIFFIYLVRPMWNGDIFPGYVHIKVPTDYKLASTYIDQNTKGRIFSLPFLNGSSAKFTWGYQGEEPSAYLFDRAVVSNYIGVPKIDKFYPLLQSYLANANFSNLLSIMSVDSVILHNDIQLTPYYQYDYSSSKKFIQNWHGISKPKQFGDLTVYTLDKNHRLGEIYSVNQLKTVSNLEEVFNMAVSDDFNPHTQGVIYKADKNITKSLVSSDPPKISYTKISSNKYTAHIQNARHPYILIFSTNYDPMWSANIGESLVTNHITINGYANAWLINKKGDYIVDITFHKNLL